MQPKISPWAFVLAVPDLDKSAAYFRDVLGFPGSLGGCDRLATCPA